MRIRAGAVPSEHTVPSSGPGQPVFGRRHDAYGSNRDATPRKCQRYDAAFKSSWDIRTYELTSRYFDVGFKIILSVNEHP